MMKFIKNAINILQMSDSEYYLNKKVTRQAYKTCLKYLADYYQLTSGMPQIFALVEAEKDLKGYTKQELRTMAAKAILQYEQKEVEV